MRKFSEIDKLNEEFLSLRKKKQEEEPKKEPVFYKASIKLLEMYCKNLCTESYIRLQEHEKDNFDFEMYKIKTITKLEPKKYHVIIVAYDDRLKALGEEEYFLQL